MPDISMCINSMCVDKERCYRFKATPSDFQSYDMMGKSGTCETCKFEADGLFEECAKCDEHNSEWLPSGKCSFFIRMKQP